MSFFKSNKTNTTAATTETTATEENTNKGGGLLTTLAIAGGTIVGITAAVVGGPKLYKKFHHNDEEIIDSDDDFDEFFEDEDVNESPVEDFKEVDTEVTENNETVKAEEAKTEETKKSCWDAFKDPKEAAPAEADEAKVEEPVKKAPVEDTTTKTEETKKSCWDAFKDPKEAAPAEAEATENNESVKAEEAKTEKPVNPEPSKKEAAPLVEKMGEYLKVFDAKMFNPLEIKLAINHIDELAGKIAGCHRTIGDNCKIEIFINKLNKGLEKFWVEMYGEIIEYKSRNEDVQAIFDDPIRMVDYAYNNMHYINRNTTVVDASAETIKLYKGLVAKAEKPEEINKPSAGENQTAENCFDVFKDVHNESNKVEGETKASTKSSDENQKLIDSIELVMDEIPVLHPERCDLKYLIRCMGGYIHKLNKDSLNKEELNQLRGYCADMTSHVNKAIRNISRDKITDVDGIHSALGGIKMIADEFVASGILEYTYTPNVEKRTFNNRYKAACERLSDAKKKMTASTTKTAKKASDETQADDNSSNETQVEEPLTFTMSEKIQEAVQQSDETAATTAPESKKTVQMSPEALELMGKLQEAGKLIKAKKWSDASEFYKTQLTPYLAYDGLTDELRDDIMSIKTLATNMMMSQKQLEAKQKAAAAKASKKKGKHHSHH